MGEDAVLNELPREAKGPNEASVLKRMSVLLNLFSETCPHIEVLDVERALAVSAATAYRYLGDLCDIGILSRVSGRYVPGPKVLELEYLIRKFDPILVAAKDLMSQLSAENGCHVLLSRIYGQSFVNIAYAKGEGLADLSYVPGRKLPPFRGSQSKIVLAFLDRRKLKRIYELHRDDEARNGIGATWEEFARALSMIKKAGFYVSRNELDQNTTGVSAPVFGEDGDVIGGLVLAYASSNPPWVGETRVIDVVKNNARLITDRIRESVDGLGEKPSPRRLA